MADFVRKCGQTVSTVFWTTIYFFYFLFKGKQEWKCENQPEPVAKTYCCVDGENGVRHRHQPPNPPPKPTTTIPNAKPQSFYLSHSGIRGFLRSTWEKIKKTARSGWEVLKSSKSKIVKVLKNTAIFIWQGIRWIFGLIGAFLFSGNVPSQTLPSTPKPYTSKPSSPTYNKVAFEFDENELRAVTKQQEIDNDQEEPTIYEDVPRVAPIPPPKSPKSPGGPASSSFYSERVYEKEAPVRAKSIPPPAPPPPPPPKPISREPSRARSTTPGTRERREVKGGIGGFGADIMDELEEQQRLRGSRAASRETQREMTQSCHPDMAQWKNEQIFGETQRASSVGPSMRKLEHVVSRIEGNNNNDDEPSFVFRPKMTYSSEEYQNKHRQENQNQNQYLLGKSVFSPVDEVERMRNEINSAKNHQQSYSSPQYSSGNWMENQRSRNVNRHDQSYDYQNQTVKNPFGSAAYKSSPYSSHTARRSKTPTRHFGPGENTSYPNSSGGADFVENIARKWPPASNNVNGRDDWVQNSMRNGGFMGGNPGGNGMVDDNGLVTTMCRRVVERKRADNWKWKDENGRLLDEKNQNTWKGELDTLLRDGPNEGRHWSRTVEKMPTGDTRFQDVNRQYNKEYVVESVVRNY
ncbi:unnamed protein product [Caenorhabditis angaria]|uniref:Uncharacterized protein n=1 Tax=Caenorhabditis angaria TaxID=860376 RepID=A0A9P1IL97_9PELO|nr:unnamed protein product [Caenorhabditis angaria]